MCCGRIYRAKFLKWGSVEYSVSIPTAPAPPTADTNCKNIPLNFCLEDALSANKNHHSFDHKYFALIYLISGGDGYGNTGCRVFNRGGTKLERFLPKNQHTHRKLLNFEFWINGKLSKIGHHFSNKVI